MDSKCREACRFTLSLAGVPDSVIVEALREASERRDPAVLYHRLSDLSPGYYGGELDVPSVEEYFKTMPWAPAVTLPPPVSISGMDALTAIASRRSRREYADEPLDVEDLATILYYTVGVTGRAWWGGPKRAYPSAGALQPVEAYVSVKSVAGVEPGVYHYDPGGHRLELIRLGDYSRRLAEACLEQDHVGEAPASIILTVVYPRTAQRYGYRAYRYVLMDAGFAGENLYIAAEALGLATVAVGAFYDREVCEIIGVDCVWEWPVLVFPVGRRVTS